MQLVTDVGFDAVDAGDLTQARLLEPLAMLWIKLAFAKGFGVDCALGQVQRASDVRFGSLADIGQRIRDVRFAPESDVLIVGINVCQVPLADINCPASHSV
jgi:hypothetical protein